MASRQDPTAADIAYAQYSAAEKTRTVGGRVYHRIICKTPLPAPVGRGGADPAAGDVSRRAGRMRRGRARPRVPACRPGDAALSGAEPPWYAQSLVFVVHGCTADGIGAFLRAL